MIQLNIKVDTPLNQLSEKYLPFVDWSNVSTSQLLSLPVTSLKYVSTNIITSTFKTQVISQISDEDLLSIIARDVKILANKYDYTKDARVEWLLHNFCTHEFVMKYAKQIHAICEMSGCNIKRIKSLLYTYNAMPIENLIGVGLYGVHWDILNSTRVPIDHRYLIMKSGTYLGYTIVYDKELDDIAPVLYTQQMMNMPFIKCVPEVFDNYAIAFIFQKNTNMFPGLAERKFITWDELIDLYYDGKIFYPQIEQAWKYFLFDGDINRDLFEQSISDMMPANSVFTKEDFM